MRLRPKLNANPIIVKELRSRMRGVRAFAILTAVLVILGLSSYALFRIVSLTSSYGSMPLSPQIGQVVFAGLVLMELLAICFITPALTAGAISGEQELQTYEMLLATPLNPASILRGKLVSALSYVFLLVFAAVPMASLVFTFGGMAPRDMLKALVILMTVAVTLGTIGIFMSALLRRTGRATVLTYLVVLALFFGTTIAYGVAGVLRQQVPPRWLLVLNPASALFSAMSPLTNGDYYSILATLSMALGGNLGVLTGQTSSSVGIPRPLYHYTLVVYGGVSLVLYLLATRLVKPVRRWRPTRTEIIGGLALCLAFGGVVALVFGLSARRYEGTGLFEVEPTPVIQSIVVQGVASKRIAVDVAEPVVPPVPTLTPAGTATPTLMPDTRSAPPAGTPLASLPTRAIALSEDDQVVIYAAVVRQLYTVDHTFGDQAPNFPVVYLLTTTDDTVGDPAAPSLGAQPVPEIVQRKMIAAVSDLPAQFIPVPSRDQVPLEQPDDRVQGDGAIITLGNIHLQPDGSVLVSAGLYFSNLGAGGRTYVLKQIDGTWQITGTTGSEWIS